MNDKEEDAYESIINNLITAIKDSLDDITEQAIEIVKLKARLAEYE